ncbi:MAG: hypothetical protein NC102_10440 [Clostridium sp.]|nr:hypothetical protein [Clostridium sp.]
MNPAAEYQNKIEAQKQRDKTICEDFTAMRSKYPHYPITIVFETLADKYRKERKAIRGVKFPKTGQQVRNIIIKNGLYAPRKYSTK